MMYDRVVAVLNGEKPDRLPFIDRLELWHTSQQRAGTLSDDFDGMSLTGIHRAVGIGQQKFMSPYRLRLRGVEVVASFYDKIYYRETDPEVDSFPLFTELVKQDKAGETTIELITPVGRLTIRNALVEDMISAVSLPYPIEHPIKEEADCRVLEYIFDRAEYVPQYERLSHEQSMIGDIGFVVPMLRRIPFQQILIDYLGEIPTFYALHDQPQFITRLLSLLDSHLVDVLQRLADLPVPFIEFGDNLHGAMTNPQLFCDFCLPTYQRYADILHGQGKKIGSHTDGDVKPLLGLLAESGLDVCESFSPFPLTACTFEEAWEAWRGGPIIWGGIPSPILERQTSERVFRDYIDTLLQTIGDQPIILGVGDMVLGNNLIERVQYIAQRIEDHIL